MKAKMNISNGYDEYKHFIIDYLLPIIGVSFNNNILKTNNSATPSSNTSAYIRQENNYIVFKAFKEDIFLVEHRQPLSEDSLSLAKCILSAFLRVSKYKMNGSFRSTQFNYASAEIHEENLKLAVQKGVCDWCAGAENSDFYRLFQLLEQWSVRTYEGKKVTFGFVFDPMATARFDNSNVNRTWFDFLNDDYAATLSDCIHSAIVLDRYCNFSDYISITEGNSVKAYNLSYSLPYRFAPVIDQYVTGSRVGVFLLNNGDIIIAKHQAIQLIKRNKKWINLSYRAFSAVIMEKFADINKNPSLLDQVYASMLDVSFSHCGGIISVVSDIDSLTRSDINANVPVLHYCDNLQNMLDINSIDHQMREEQKTNYGIKEINKRLLKRQALISLVGNKTFQKTDRKLRAELISMDGACIIGIDGTVYSYGAIIQNDSGSSGGGRSAAAKKLSKYGLSIKISADGYIEVFVKCNRIYAIK